MRHLWNEILMESQGDSTSSHSLSERGTTKERNTLVYKLRNRERKKTYMHLLKKILKTYQHVQNNILK